MNLMMMFMMTIILILMIMLLILSMAKKSINDKQKASPFECGFNSMSNKRLPFSIHFFMIAIIFLIFDVEIIIILPMILTLKSTMISNWMLTSIVFITILIIGLIHEWYNGFLNWT